MIHFHRDSTTLFWLWWRLLWFVSDRKVGPISISSICECNSLSKSFRKHMFKRMVSEQMFSLEVTIVSSNNFASIILRNVNVICKYYLIASGGMKWMLWCLWCHFLLLWCLAFWNLKNFIMISVFAYWMAIRSSSK